MTITKIELKDIDCSVIYVTAKELTKELRVHKNTILRHMRMGYLDALHVESRGTYYMTTESAEKYKKLYSSGILAPRERK